MDTLRGFPPACGATSKGTASRGRLSSRPTRGWWVDRVGMPWSIYIVYLDMPHLTNESTPTPQRTQPQMSVARYDSSHGGHLGVMASWQCRGQYAARSPTHAQQPQARPRRPPRRRG